MMRRILILMILLIGCLTLWAGPTENKETAEEALAKIDAQIAHEQQAGDLTKEGLARWQKIQV